MIIEENLKKEETKLIEQENSVIKKETTNNSK